jgi:nucleoid DNA-binding protein
MANNNPKMKIEDFLLLWGQNVSGVQPSPNTLRKYLEGLKKTILEELELNGELYIFEFGTFLLEHKKGGDRRFNNVSTGMVERKYIPPKSFLRFNPSVAMNRAIQNNFVLEKKEPRPRKYKNPREAYKAKIERQRKKKPSIEDVAMRLMTKSENQVRKTKEVEDGE